MYLVISEIICKSEQTTKNFAKEFSAGLNGGELIELIGDVGSGKTVFTKGLAEGLGSNDPVTSPTFTLKNTYDGRINLIHFDLYRLDNPGLIQHELSEAMEEPKSIVVIEWGGVAEEVLPKKRVTVKFEVQANETRKLKINDPYN